MIGQELSRPNSRSIILRVFLGPVSSFSFACTFTITSTASFSNTFNCPIVFVLKEMNGKAQEGLEFSRHFRECSSKEMKDLVGKNRTAKVGIERLGSGAINSVVRVTRRGELFSSEIETVESSSSKVLYLQV